MEIWKSIEKFNDYEISNQGRVKSLANSASKKERILRYLITPKGYYRVALFNNKKPYFKAVHRLVAESFIENPLNKKTINHIDGDKSNNNDWNLEYATYRENMNHAIKNKLTTCGEKNHKSKLNWNDVNYIRESSFSTNELCEKYDVVKNTINRIKNNTG